MILEAIKKKMKADRIKAINICLNTGMSQTQFSLFINGKIDVGYKTVDKILSYLNLTINEE